MDWTELIRLTFRSAFSIIPSIFFPSLNLVSIFFPSLTLVSNHCRVDLGIDVTKSTLLYLAIFIFCNENLCLKLTQISWIRYPFNIQTSGSKQHSVARCNKLGHSDVCYNNTQTSYGSFNLLATQFAQNLINLSFKM